MGGIRRDLPLGQLLRTLDFLPKIKTFFASQKFVEYDVYIALDCPHKRSDLCSQYTRLSLRSYSFSYFFLFANSIHWRAAEAGGAFSIALRKMFVPKRQHGHSRRVSHGKCYFLHRMPAAYPPSKGISSSNCEGGGTRWDRSLRLLHRARIFYEWSTSTRVSCIFQAIV